MPILMAHRVPGMHLREPRRQALSRRLQVRQFLERGRLLDSTTPASSRARVAPTPGRASRRLLPWDRKAKGAPGTPHQAAERIRARQKGHKGTGAQGAKKARTSARGVSQAQASHAAQAAGTAAKTAASSSATRPRWHGGGSGLAAGPVGVLCGVAPMLVALVIGQTISGLVRVLGRGRNAPWRASPYVTYEMVEGQYPLPAGVRASRVHHHADVTKVRTGSSWVLAARPQPVRDEMGVVFRLSSKVVGKAGCDHAGSTRSTFDHHAYCGVQGMWSAFGAKPRVPAGIPLPRQLLIKQAIAFFL